MSGQWQWDSRGLPDAGGRSTVTHLTSSNGGAGLVSDGGLGGGGGEAGLENIYNVTSRHITAHQ